MQSITPPPLPPGPAAEVSIIRTGRDGRLRFTPDQRRKLLAAFDRGGRSATAFARGHGVNYQRPSSPGCASAGSTASRRRAARRSPRCGLSPRHAPRRGASPCPAPRWWTNQDDLAALLPSRWQAAPAPAPGPVVETGAAASGV